MKRDSITTHKNGFSLIELVVVLLILAVLATIAVPRSTGALEQRRIAAAKEELAAIRTAVLGEGRAIEGFYADMGRLPCAVLNADGRYCLQELWQCPEDSEWTLATASEDSSVSLGVGWRGPYLDLQEDRLKDPWGIEYADEQGTSASESRLLKKSDLSVYGVRCFYGAESFTTSFDAPTATLQVTVQALDGNGALSSQPLGTVTVRVWQPDPNRPGHLKCVSATDSSETNVRTLTLSNLIPGERIVRISSATRGMGPIRKLKLQSGANQLFQSFSVATIHADSTDFEE